MRQVGGMEELVTKEIEKDQRELGLGLKILNGEYDLKWPCIDMVGKLEFI